VIIEKYFSKNKITIPKIQFFGKYNKKSVKSVGKYILESLVK